MFSYTDTILSIMQRIEVYNEIFKAISKEVQEYGCNQAAHRRVVTLICFAEIM